MARAIALLRGINVGKARRIGMADLRAALEEAGYADVRTLGQSGNVVLSADASGDALARELEKVIADAVGVDPLVVVRTPRQLAAVVERNPLGDVVAEEPRRCLVHFLSAKPDAAALRALRSADVAPEVFAAHGRELYSWHPEGLQNSKLAKLLADAPLGVTVTNRNWNTVTKLLALARD
jgi:uncharacterized protein (DUF1697 family)